ncbi:MAG: PQQ-dependent sugar dehydrogenase [Lewinellaceae bacterium]|nr:PQQ-dependent sugar dehydrogenase [Lewinellaceae bacterium]
MTVSFYVRTVTAIICLTANLHAANLPPGFAEVAIAEGLNPTAMALAPDGSIFLAQKDGRVFLVHADGVVHTEPFLTLAVDDFNERGLAGIAVHPNFEQEPWIYLYYTVAGAGHNRVSRVWANGDFAVPGSEQVLLDLDPMAGNIHNGGALVFGPDENLYIAVGDGASPANAQNLNSLLGKILRIHPNGSIPLTNPFFSQVSGNNRAIYAYGVRNPFSMSSDLAGGRIFFCDVGNGAWEEINELLPGKNYGWSLVEGPQNGQSLPSDYQEPLYAYPHGQGCAVVGAAFGLGSHPGIPQEYRNKFFFADYCAGWVRLLDPLTGEVSGTFATGIDRPVSLLVGPAGELYYFARAGLGGGTPNDNTASAEGTLWKIFWIGDGAPQITGHPRDVHASVGETAEFTAGAFGAQPITYQWFRNQMPMPDADSAALLVLENLTLADSGALFVCVASNAFGTDTSAPAELRVTANQRPQPEILLPATNTTYRGSDTLYFMGRAIDFEDGILPANRLTWRIDFHHAGHTHPALSPTTGISEGNFVVPTVGETATDVFFRIYLSATDSSGLSRTSWLDIQPERTTFTLDGPSGIPVNSDGQIHLLPATLPSVIQLQHSVQATLFFQKQDTLFYFREWGDATTNPLRTFLASEIPETHSLLYDRFVLGNGTGLQGAYFFDPEGTLEGMPALVRTDTTIQFDWAANSPDPDLLPADYFSVRWTGFIEPVFSETYSFHVRSDDGARLWVGDSLLVDQWVPQVATEHTGTIYLQKDNRYPIRMEYLEIGGGALAELRWSSPKQIKQIVPKRQLYPPDTVHTATVKGTTGIDGNLNGTWENGETVLPDVSVRLFRALDDSLVAIEKTGGNGRYFFDHQPPGVYYLHFQPNTTSGTLAPSENVDSDGFTADFSLDALESKTLNAAWIVDKAALYGSVWFDENRNDHWDFDESGLEKVSVLLYTNDSALVSATATDNNGGFLFPLVQSGAYFLWFSNHLVSIPSAPGFGLNAESNTPVFEMNTGESQNVQVAFVPEEVSGTSNATPRSGPIRAWPNPATNQLFLSVEATERQEVSLALFDLHGQVVFHQKTTAEPGQNTWALPVGNLSPGMYILTCHSNENRRHQRWIKE